jgi:hypothetical protein
MPAVLESVGLIEIPHSPDMAIIEEMEMQKKKLTHPPVSTAQPAGIITALRKRGSIEQLQTRRRKASLGDQDPEISARSLDTVKEANPVQQTLEAEDLEVVPASSPHSRSTSGVPSPLTNNIQVTPPLTPIPPVELGQDSTNSSTHGGGGGEKTLFLSSLSRRIQKVLPRRNSEDQENNPSSNGHQGVSVSPTKPTLSHTVSLQKANGIAKRELESLAKIFASNMDLVKAYVAYTHVLIDAIGAFEKLHGGWDARARTNGIGFLELLIEPVTRLLQYCTLLEAMTQGNHDRKLAAVYSSVKRSCGDVTTSLHTAFRLPVLA